MENPTAPEAKNLTGDVARKLGITKEKKMCPHLKKPCLEHDCMAWRYMYTIEKRGFWDCAIICGQENQAQPFQV